MNWLRMFRAFVFAGLCCDAFGSSLDLPKIDGRIIGGKPVSIRDYSYQISLETVGVVIWSHICGGAIVSASYILTAAHCTNGTSASRMRVRAGTSIKGSGGQVRYVAQFFQHPKFIHTSKTIDYDISVLRLTKRLTIGTGVESIPMASSNLVIPPGSLCYVSGWGKSTEVNGGTSPSHLQAVVIPSISQSDCKRIYSFFTINDRMICAGFAKGGKGPCSGDSGGPLWYDEELVGLVSWGVGCGGPNQPGVFTNVAYFRTWILQQMGIAA